MALVQPWIHPLLNALKRPTPWRCVSLWWVLLCLGACSQDEASVELECQGLEKSHTLTERDGVATVEDTTLTVKRHFSLIQHELNSVLCDQWDERQIHCWVEDHPKSKNKTFKKASLINARGFSGGRSPLGEEGPDLGLLSNEIVWQLVFAR